MITSLSNQGHRTRLTARSDFLFRKARPHPIRHAASSFMSAARAHGNSMYFILNLLNKIKYSLMAVVMIAIWLMAGMVWFDWFLPPFDRLQPWLMPWKSLFLIPAEATFGERLSFMQGVLEASGRVSSISFLTMIGSFVLFSFYATLVYQQRQRRARENDLLLLKNQEIARRNEFIRYISATIGHEFKNNLGRIKRRIDLLPDLPQDMKLRLDDNLEKLFADIEIFKKISDERESVLTDFKKVNLEEMLVGLAQQYGDLVEMNFRSDIRHPAIIASPALLKTVFENIIDNAVKYKKSEQERARLSVSCVMDIDGSRRYVSLSFRDEGVGMDELQTGRCFYKGKVTQKGWGEGLHFAKYVVGLHAGKIRVGKDYTVQGIGTEIIINLPYVEEAMNV